MATTQQKLATCDALCLEPVANLQSMYQGLLIMNRLLKNIDLAWHFAEMHSLSYLLRSSNNFDNSLPYISHLVYDLFAFCPYLLGIPYCVDVNYYVMMKKKAKSYSWVNWYSLLLSTLDYLNFMPRREVLTVPDLGWRDGQ